MASDNRQFDPRFDRAFQPGFDDFGPLPSAFPMPLDAPRVSTPQPEGLVSLDPLDRSAPAEPDRSGSPTQPALVSVADLRTAMDAAAPSLDGNPWLRALWVISALFVVLGIAANVYTQQLYSTGIVGNAFSSLVLPSVLSGLSGWLTVAGLLAGIGAVMLHAVRWRPPAE